MIRYLTLCLWIAGPAVGQVSLTDQTDAAAGRLAEAHLTLQAAKTAPNPVPALTAAARTYEDAMIPLRVAAADAIAASDAAEAALDAKGPAVSQMLTTLMSMSSAQPAALPLHPDGAAASLRSALIQDDAATAFATEAALLRTDFEALARAQDARASAIAALDVAEAGGEEARRALADALANRPALPQRFVADPVQVALLSATAETFANLTQSLDETYGQGLPNDAMLASKGRLPQPVTGRVLRGFGAENSAGQARRGITFATPAQALVVSPTAATILFQGPAASFDNVVITEPTTGVVMIYAGLSEAYGTAGQIIPAGTPLGVMGGLSAPSDMNLTTFPASESGGASQALYLEVREGQTPVDPATWFALEQQVDEQ